MYRWGMPLTREWAVWLLYRELFRARVGYTQATEFQINLTRISAAAHD
jgi:hypothetical protein